MANQMQSGRAQDRVKIRSPWAAALLPFVTLGIYHLVWWYRINREMRDYGKGKGYDLGQNPTNSVLALFPGGSSSSPPWLPTCAGPSAGGAPPASPAKSRSTAGSHPPLHNSSPPRSWAYIQAESTRSGRPRLTRWRDSRRPPPPPTRCHRRCPPEPQAAPEPPAGGSAAARAAAI